tara:strand:+ start:475 stop:1608 length:1134 start_codon:yes stop_codon:yes gene_type:complete
MISGDTISNISERALIMSIMGNLCETKSQKISPHFFVDLYKNEINQISFMLNSIRTSLGTFWEVIAEEFAKRNGYEVLNKKSFKPAKNLRKNKEKMEHSHKKVADKMQELINERLSGNESLISKYCETLDKIYENRPIDNSTDEWAGGEGIDLYFKKEDKYWIFDIKTVQINASGGNKFDQQLIKWLTHQKHQLGGTISAKNITVGYIFPYNSKAGGDQTSHEEWMEDQGHKAKPMTDKEIYAGNKFWEFITGNENALLKIFAGIKKALGGDSIVKKNLDKYLVTGVMAPDKLDSLAEDATKDFAKYLYNINFESKDEKWTHWNHGEDNDKCTFKKSITTIWKNAQGSGSRTGLERYLKDLNKCPTCKKKIKLSNFE